MRRSGEVVWMLGLVAAASASAVWSPSSPVSWHLQLNGEIPLGLDVAMIDFDLFDTPQATIDAYKAAGTVVICYFSAGSYEDWRTDAADFPSVILGNELDGWPGEKWLDIRDKTALPGIMTARMDLAVSKKCDGIDPDNVNGYSNPTGFALTAEDQISFNTWLADEAHSRNLSIGLKNDLEQIEDLKDFFDWALNEECFHYDECGLYDPFTALSKVVFGVEYEGFTTQDSFKAQVCDVADVSGKSWLYADISLSSSTKCACIEPGTSINCEALLTLSSSNYFATKNSSEEQSTEDPKNTETDSGSSAAFYIALNSWFLIWGLFFTNTLLV